MTVNYCDACREPGTIHSPTLMGALKVSDGAECRNFIDYDLCARCLEKLRGIVRHQQWRAAAERLA